MAAASSSNAPVGGESASDEESVRSDDQHSAVRAAAGSIRRGVTLVSAARVEKQAEATHQTRMTTVPLLASSTFDLAPKVSILYFSKEAATVGPRELY